MSQYISTSFSMEQLARARQLGIECESRDHSCPCGQLKLILGSQIDKGCKEHWLLYSHGELLFKVRSILDIDMAVWEEQRQEVDQFIQEIGCDS